MIFLVKKDSDKDNNLQMEKSKNISENKMKCNVVDVCKKLKNMNKLSENISNKSSKSLKSNVENTKCQCKRKRVFKTFLHFKYISLNIISNNPTLINNYNYTFQKRARKMATNSNVY